MRVRDISLTQFFKMCKRSFIIRMKAFAEHTVIGMPDARLGERICAYAVLKPEVATFSLNDLLACLKENEVPKWQWPERLEIVEKLPRTDSGKIKKYVLHKDIAKRMGLSDRVAKGEAI